MITRELLGLSFREYIGLSTGLSVPAVGLTDLLERHEEIAHHLIERLAQENAQVLPLFKQYLKTGVYPYHLDFSSYDDFALTLQQNVDRTIEGDLTAAYPRLSGVTLRKLRLLLAIISRSAPFTPHLRKLSEMLDVGDERTLKEYFSYLEGGRLIRLLPASGSMATELTKLEKIFLDNPCLAQAISPQLTADLGALRESFFLMVVSSRHKVTAPRKGDFEVDGKYLFEIGEKGKTFHQIKDLPHSYLAIDDCEVGTRARIPLWLFGFLY